MHMAIIAFCDPSNRMSDNPLPATPASHCHSAPRAPAGRRERRRGATAADSQVAVVLLGQVDGTITSG